MIEIRKFSEQFEDGFKSSYGNYVEIFANPTPKELHTALNQSGDDCIRFLASNDTKKVYVFQSDVLHLNAIRKIRLTALTTLTGIAEIRGNAWFCIGSSLLEFYLYGNQKEEDLALTVLDQDWRWVDSYIDCSSALKRYRKTLEAFS